jgi:tRNA U34 5-methylaminomethyl-2-thiouridine-forming methyltransferase MnmC
MKYTQIITGDTSITFFNEKYQEAYHSVTGAVEEAFEKYAIPCLNDKLSKKYISILDVCFGMGYNSMAAIHYLRKNRSSSKLRIVALENDTGILKKIKEIRIPDILRDEFEIIKALAAKYAYTDKNLYAALYVGDARKTIKNLRQKFDVVFLDPFSPKKCPELWTEEFFADIFRVMEKGGILATYSCAGEVRRNLKKAGFNVKDGPVVGRRSPATLAYK